MMFGQPMTGTEQRLRRHRLTRPGERIGAYRARRVWAIVPRYGTGPDDRWTLIGTPVPAADNLAAAFEDGQYPTIAAAREALKDAARADDGTHENLI
jgi:hypothetical protein